MYPAPRTRVVTLDHHTLAGQPVESLSLRGCCYGRPLGDAPTFVLMGGITATPYALGDGESPGWWSALTRPGLLDPTRHTIVCPAMLGNGSGWAALERAPRARPHPLPPVSVSDLADLVELWLAGIGCRGSVCFVGASLGGLIGLGLALRHPARVHRLVSVSAGLGPDGWATGMRHLQREVVLDGLRAADDEALARAMSHARQLGMLTYRGRTEINQRFSLLRAQDEAPAIASYLQHNGKKFARQFSPHAFLMLSESIDRCSFGSDPDDLRTALARVNATTAVVGVPEDLLFPWALQDTLHRELVASGVSSSMWTLRSKYGHDAFLADQEALATLLEDHDLLGVGRVAATG